MMKTTFLKTMLMLVAIVCGCNGINAKEVYVVHDLQNKVLTFYYDNQRTSRGGALLPAECTATNVPWNNSRLDVRSVVFDKSFDDCRTTTTAYWFYGLRSLENITGLNYLHTDQVTDMKYMFYYCGLKTLDVSSFNTSNVTNMVGMFEKCWYLTEIKGLDKFDTSNVTNMSIMFSECSRLKEVDVSGFNTSKTTAMANMFDGIGLETLDLSNFETSSVTNMREMFKSCISLKTIYVDKEKWNTKNVTLGVRMFWYCNNLVGGSGTQCDGQNNIDVSYARVDGGSSNPGYLTHKANGGEPYAVLSNNNTVLTFYCDNKKASRNGMSIGPFAAEDERGWSANSKNITKVVFSSSLGNYKSLTSTAYWFYGFNNLTTVEGMENLHVDNVTTMDRMFINCRSLTTLDLSTFNTAKVQNMAWMLASCTELVTIYASSSWSTASVTEGINMFYNSKKLKGEQGTTYSMGGRNYNYARIDGGTDAPGYFTAKSTGVNAVEAGKTVEMSTIYDVNGRRQQDVHKGLNIVRMTDGSVRKVVVR